MKHILSFGLGSVGSRHLRNFQALGCSVAAMDPRADRLEAFPAADRFLTVEQALASPRPFDGVVISSPPSFHVDQCLAAAAHNLPVLLEKPLSPTLQEALRLRDARAKLTSPPPLLMGYTYRWWPPLLRFKQLLAEGHLGKLRHAKFVMSAHLADWHPWEPYQQFFMASKALGGGALLDESHFIDLILWFFGPPEKLMARVEKISDLDIDTDDNVDMVAVYPNGFRVSMHLDLIGRPHQKFISIMGEGGTLEWSFDPNRVRLGRTDAQVWEDETFTYERNDMFVGLAKSFLDVLHGAPVPVCQLEDGIAALRVVEACRLSSQLERTVHLAEIPE